MERVSQEQPEKRPLKDFSTFEDFGIFEDQLHQLNGYSILSEGQKRLVFENFRGIILGEVHRKAHISHTKRIQDAAQEDSYKGDAKRYGFYLFRGFYVRLREREAIEDLTSIDFRIQKNLLQYLIHSAAEFDVALSSENGEITIQYVTLEDATQQEREVVTAFNKAATRLAQTPDEWRYATAKKSQQKTLGHIEAEYAAVRDAMLAILMQRYPKGSEAMQVMALIEHRMRLNQFFNTNPDAERQLTRIAKHNPTAGTLATIMKESGVYGTTSLTIRLVATALTNTAVFPLVAYFAGRRSVRRKLTEEQQLARYGVGGLREANLDVVKAKDLIDKLRALKSRRDCATDPEEYALLTGLLQRRLFYTETKIQRGLVTYGYGRVRFNHFYNLHSICTEIRTIFDLEDLKREQPELEPNADVAAVEASAQKTLERLKSMIELGFIKTKEEQDNFVKKAGWTSLKYSAGIFTVPRMFGTEVIPFINEKARFLFSTPTLFSELGDIQVEDVATDIEI